MVPLARVYRGGLLESIHSGSIAVVDSSGRLLAYAGEPSFVTCLRSAAKPFQAMPLLQNGGVEEFDLTEEEIALTCGSHGGEAVHVATAAALLRKGDFDEEDLLCAAHLPYDEKAAAEVRASGDGPSALHNNCSGKHAGMLLATKLLDLPSANYVAADHPLQQLIRDVVGEFADTAADDVPIAVDGCGVPAFFLSLHRAAFAYARLMMRADDASSRIVDAMTKFPHYVGGGWTMTTPLMHAFGGDLLAKEGAEGFYAMALDPSLTDRLNVADDGAVGIALKIADGSMTRGRNPVILKTLELLGVDIGARRELERYGEWPLRNVAGAIVGEVRAEFDLELL